MDRRGFLWRLLGALAAPAVCWRPPGLELEPPRLMFHKDAVLLVMSPLQQLLVVSGGKGYIYEIPLPKDPVRLDIISGTARVDAAEDRTAGIRMRYLKEITAEWEHKG